MECDCIYGLREESCKSAGRLMSKYNFSYNTCSNCQLSPGLEYLIECYKELEKEDQVKTSRLIKNIGLTEIVFNEGRQCNVNFICPLTNQKLIIDCTLINCTYHIDYIWTGNCLLAYMAQQEKKTLCFKEISYLLKKPLAIVEQLYQDALWSLKRKMLNDSLESPRFTYFQTMEICCVCECSIEKHLIRTNQLVLPQNLLFNELGLVFCSQECLKAKPKKLIELEVEFETHIKYIIKGALYFYKNNIKSVLNVLSITPELLNHACIRYLGWSLKNEKRKRTRIYE